jgi:hypothetical protein
MVLKVTKTTSSDRKALRDREVFLFMRPSLTKIFSDYN